MGVLGQYNRNLRLISQVFSKAKIVARGDRILIEGEAEDVEKLERLFGKLLEVARTNRMPSLEEVRYLLTQIEEGGDLTGVLTDVIQITHWGEAIRPKTAGQKRYIEAIKENDVVFAIGPAGTGKTYLAVAMALSYLQQGKVKRLILTRPAVEAGEQLGFLPGDIFQKVNPYLRPLYDAIYDMIPAPELDKYIQTGRVEIAPLAFMRGRTLNNAFIILDEAQNTTREQMKMILTRLGFDSKLVVTADVTQIDLPQPRKSGVLQAVKVLSSIPEIAFIYFNEKDVVRHPLVGKIIKAYAKAESKSI